MPVEIKKAYHPVEIKLDAGSADADAAFVLSASSADRVGDTIDAQAYVAAAKMDKLIALWQHDVDRPIGTWKNLEAKSDRLTARIKFASTSYGQLARQLLLDGVPLGASIGFRGRGEPNEKGGIHFKEIELLECSIVSIPAHPKARQIAKNLGLGPEAVSADSGVLIHTSSKGIGSAVSAPRSQGNTTMPDLADRIAAAEAEVVTLKNDLTGAVDRLAEATDEDRDAVQAEVDELSVRTEKKESVLASLKKAQATLAVNARPAGGGGNGGLAAPSIITSHPTFKSEQPGDLLFKMATAVLIAFATKTTVEAVMADRYKGHNALPAVWDFVRKTAVAPADTTTSGWASQLVQTDVRGFLETLKDVSVAAAIAPMSTLLDFGGFNSITVPRRNPLGSTPTEPAWVGEGGGIPLTSFSFGAATINRFKLAAITTFSKEIAERSTPAIEGLLRTAMREQYAKVLDNALLSTTAAVANVRPAGLRNGVSAGTGTAGGGDAAVRADIKAMLSAMYTAKTGSRPVLMLNSVDRLSVSMMTTALGEEAFAEQLAGGKLLGIDVVASMHVPSQVAIMVDADALATAFDTPMFDASDVATVVEANADGTAPTHAADSAGDLATAGQVGPNAGIAVHGTTAGTAVTGYKARSLWQTWSVGLRMVAPTSWALLRDGSVQVTTGLTW